MTEWKFVPKNDELLLCKPWLKLVPEDGILAPGESFTIKIYLFYTSEIFASERTEDAKNLVRFHCILSVFVSPFSFLFV
jgi:hypothetical protein